VQHARLGPANQARGQQTAATALVNGCLDQLCSGVVEGVAGMTLRWWLAEAVEMMQRLSADVVVVVEGFAFRDCIAGFLAGRSVHPSVLGASPLRFCRFPHSNGAPAAKRLHGLLGRGWCKGRGVLVLRDSRLSPALDADWMVDKRAAPTNVQAHA